MGLTFTPLDECPGVEVIDPVERQRYRLLTPDPVQPTPASTDTFRFPVGSAVDIRTSAIVLPTVVPVYVRDADGGLVAEVKQFESAEVPADTYSIDLCTRIKTYLRVHADFEVSVSMEETRIEFAEEVDVRVGARSRHERPAATVTTTEDPLDVMAAVETFGSALKTTDPERSYPTLRGHPPALELGDSLDIPDTIERPDTGITLELPPDLPSVFVAAPLSYYLGASIRPGPSPRLLTDDGFEYSLAGPDGYERTVERTLKQLFFLDCVTRTEGFYEIDLHERRAVEPYVDLDFADLYDRPLSEQVAAYLGVSYDVVADHVPEWRLTTHIEPLAEHATQLPFVVDDLAIVRTPQAAPTTGTSAPAGYDQQLTRANDFTRSASADADADSGTTDYVEPQSDQTLEQAWIGDRIPIGASKLTQAAFENRLDRETTEGDIAITVVQNDARMAEEREIADAVYGNRSDLPFDITVRENLTTDELEAELRKSSDFFHYIGHTDHDGFTCEDGTLDARDIDAVGVDTFLLNACNSYNQGLALVERGAIGGIVTLNEVLNDGAVAIGESVARLLNSGFPLRAALTIAREESILGGQYIVVGDGGITVTQPSGGSPNRLKIERIGDEFEVDITTYPTDERGLGTIHMPFIGTNNRYYLASGTIGTFRVTEDELRDYLNLENVPIKFEGESIWSDSFLNKDI
ncbi:CHAT domain-containing protein [Haloarcula marina]|uniref:CHAT domain-containing protein n=1 Tax=Haloarcula marina TaxID=2961574 RepID=UPI0020B77BEC|nr:CHAT domain-containing protein [Halomicroarcula marina]